MMEAKKTPACPKWLMPEAKTEWRRLANKIRIADEDIAAFAGYCQSHAAAPVRPSPWTVRAA